MIWRISKWQSANKIQCSKLRLKHFRAVKDSYKASFVQNLEQILKSIQASLDKITTRRESLQTDKDALYDNLQLIVDKQRIYNAAVADFQSVCLKLFQRYLIN